VLLAVWDRAGNYRQARRLVLYYADPKVTVAPTRILRVTTAGKDGKVVHGGDELWQTTNGAFSADWEGLFSDYDTGL
jgi:hypothetical protein